MSLERYKTKILLCWLLRLLLWPNNVALEVGFSLLREWEAANTAASEGEANQPTTAVWQGKTNVYQQIPLNKISDLCFFRSHFYVASENAIFLFSFSASLVKSLCLKIPLLDDSTICIINNKRITPFQALPASLGHDSMKKCFTPINLQSVLWFMRLLKNIWPLGSHSFTGRSIEILMDFEVMKSLYRHRRLEMKNRWDIYVIVHLCYKVVATIWLN